MDNNNYSFPLNLQQCRLLEQTARTNKGSKYSKYINTELFGLFTDAIILIFMRSTAIEYCDAVHSFATGKHYN